LLISEVVQTNDTMVFSDCFEMSYSSLPFHVAYL